MGRWVRLDEAMEQQAMLAVRKAEAFIARRGGVSELPVESQQEADTLTAPWNGIADVPLRKRVDGAWVAVPPTDTAEDDRPEPVANFTVYPRWIDRPFDPLRGMRRARAWPL